MDRYLNETEETRFENLPPFGYTVRRLSSTYPQSYTVEDAIKAAKLLDKRAKEFTVHYDSGLCVRLRSGK